MLLGLGVATVDTRAADEDASDAEETDAPSFVVNGSFEQHKGDSPKGWKRTLYPGREGASEFIYLSDAQAKDGEWSLKLDATNVPPQPDAPDQSSLVLLNGSVDRSALDHRGQQLVLSGWVYVEAGSAPSPFRLRVRKYGPKGDRPRVNLGELMEVEAKGRPGEWVRFEQSAVLAPHIEKLDLTGGWYHLDKPSVQYLDDIRLTVHPTDQADE